MSSGVDQYDNTPMLLWCSSNKNRKAHIIFNSEDNMIAVMKSNGFLVHTSNQTVILSNL